MPRLGRRDVLSLIFSAVLAFSAHAQVQMPGESDENFRQRKANQERFMAESAAVQKMPRPDTALHSKLPKAHPRSPSAWRTAEKAFYEEILAKARVDVLVAPFQVQDQGFSREIRSLMTAQLVAAIADAGGPSVADPYLVARALGDGERQLDLAQVFNLAGKLEAKRVVLVWVGHDPKKAMTMRVTLQYCDRDDRFRWEVCPPRPGVFAIGALIPSARMNIRNFDDVAFSDPQTPIEAYQGLLPGMLEFLGLKYAAPARVVSRFESSALPNSPLAMVSSKAEAARDAYYFQLLAALAPESAERVRERLNEKSLLALEQMSPKSPDYRALRARALMNIGLRPAALHALGKPATPEEKHLAALLNGNLPEVQANRSKVAPGIRAVLAALEENAIAAAYGVRSQEKSLAEVEAMKLPGDVWQFLAARAMTDWNDWAQHNNLALKGLLDHEFPIAGFTAEAMARGAAALGDPRFDARVDLSVHDHVRRQTQAAADKWCCQPLAARPGALDYLDLLEGMGTDNLLRRAKFLAHIQGQPESTVRFLARIDGVYKDHPQFTVVRAQAEFQLADNVGGAQSDTLRRTAYISAFNAWYWEQGQTRAAADAFQDVIGRSVRQDYYGGYDNLYAADYPYRPFYPFSAVPWLAETKVRNARAALENSSFDFSPVDQIIKSLGYQQQWDQADVILRSLENRFAGHPQRVQLMAESSQRKGDLAAAEKHYRDGIRARPSDEASYQKLGQLLFESAAPEKAAGVFRSYPGLANDSDANPVSLSNYASSAGSLFYWSGQFELAVPFYDIAAKLRTGSDASISSAIRLNLLKGDYAAALTGSLERAQRYQSPYAYRDALGLLHALGRSAEAWDAFNALVGQINHPAVWETALVGHRMRSTSEQELAAWHAREPMRSAGPYHAYAPVALLRTGMTDRTPSAQLPSLLASVERPVWKLDDSEGNVVRPVANESEYFVLGPKAAHDTTLTRRHFAGANKTRVKSDFVYFAEAYRSIRLGAFEAARATLEEATTLYDVKNESLGYLLPYYAYAAARARKVAPLEALLDQISGQYRRFDYYLSRGVIAALAGKADESLRDLKLALHRRPFTGRRPVYSEYQYAELCEWLFETTRNPKYRDEALRWARANQAFQPWFAWAYAMEARLTTNKDERGRAIAIAYYLDKGSERLAKLPADEVAAAVMEHGHRNPFRQENGTPKRPI